MLGKQLAFKNFLEPKNLGTYCRYNLSQEPSGNLRLKLPSEWESLTMPSE